MIVYPLVMYPLVVYGCDDVLRLIWANARGDAAFACGDDMDADLGDRSGMVQAPELPPSWACYMI